MAACRARYPYGLPQEVALRRKVVRQLEAVMHGCEDIVDNLDHLLDRARFQEKQLLDLVRA
jgi:hypothetical protein